VLTTTSEQQLPVCNNQPYPHFYKIDYNLRGTNCEQRPPWNNSGHFFESQGGLLYTGLTVIFYCFAKNDGK
jgi:hypothetical protein